LFFLGHGGDAVRWQRQCFPRLQMRYVRIKQLSAVNFSLSNSCPPLLPTLHAALPAPGTQQTSHSPSKTLKTKEIPHRADHHPCVLFPVAFTTTNLNSNT